MIFVYCVLVALCVVCVSLFLVMRLKNPNQTSLLAKLFASLMFVLIGGLSLTFSGFTAAKTMFLLGLFCGLIGDMLLELKVNYGEHIGGYLNSGTMFFAFGHVLYFLGIIIYVSSQVVTGWWWMVLAAFVFSLLAGYMVLKVAPTLKMDFSGFKCQSYFYSSELIFVMIISICLTFAKPLAILLAVGFVLFFISDLILSKQYFGGKQDSKLCSVLNHSLYYLAQILIATFIYFL